MAAPTDTRRAHSVGPARRKTSAASQNTSGGLFRKSVKSRCGEIQSPLSTISRATSAQRARPEGESDRPPAPDRQRPRERDDTLLADCHSGSLGDRWTKVNALAWVPPAR